MDDDDDIVFKNKYLLLISNASKEGKPEAFTNTLTEEIDGVTGGRKEIALVNINLPTAWHRTTAAVVTGHAFLLHVPLVSATTLSWINFSNSIRAANPNMTLLARNAILGSFPPSTVYDTVREYIQKGILDPLNVFLDGLALPTEHEDAEMTAVAGEEPLVYLEGAVYNGKNLAPNSYVINILFNAKSAEAISLYPNDFTRTNTFWHDGNDHLVKAITSSTPRGQTLWFRANNYMKLNVDQPAKLHGNTVLDNSFQMFYIYMDILEARFVGNKEYRLLGAIPNPGKESQQNSFSYDYTINPPLYIPIEERTHRAIEITIRDDKDRPVFFEWGVTSLLVHLRKK